MTGRKLPSTKSINGLENSEHFDKYANPNNILFVRQNDLGTNRPTNSNNKIVPEYVL